MIEFTKEMMEDPKIKEALHSAGEIAGQAIKDLGYDQNPTLQAVADGQTIAQARGLTRDDLEVVYTVGFQLMTAGDLSRAEDTFITLAMIDQLEAKNHYCLGVSRQLQEKWLPAFDDFIRFLALDATNPEGYLRAGECKAALGERDEAHAYFELALAEAEAGNGPQDATEQAERALSALNLED